MLKTIHNGSFTVADITQKVMPSYELLTRLERELDAFLDMVKNVADRTEVILVTVDGENGVAGHDVPVTVRIADLIQAKRYEIDTVARTLDITHKTLLAAVDRLMTYDAHAEEAPLTPTGEAQLGMRPLPAPTRSLFKDLRLTGEEAEKDASDKLTKLSQVRGFSQGI